MNEGLQKTIELLLIILIGYFLQRKVQSKQQLHGLKTIILSVALPATIFLALLKIELSPGLLFLPFLALAFNLLMFLACTYLLRIFTNEKNEAIIRTQKMILPSMAPGLSCFPFIAVYLGSDEVALAALADVGNKFFGLILLYLLAMYWYQRRSVNQVTDSMSTKLKSLMKSLSGEPINIMILIALILLSCGITISSLPGIFGSVFQKLSILMTPLILLYIGLSIRVTKSDFVQVINLLTWRMSMSFLIVGFLLLCFPRLSLAMATLILAFSQCSCSFWPFAHICMVDQIEKKDEHPYPTFDQDYAIKILACSLPFSTVVIISIFQFSNLIVDPFVLIGTSAGLLMLLYLSNKKISIVKPKMERSTRRSALVREHQASI